MTRHSQPAPQPGQPDDARPDAMPQPPQERRAGTATGRPEADKDISTGVDTGQVQPGDTQNAHT